MAMINFNQVKGGSQLLTNVEGKLDKSAVVAESSETPADDKVLSEKATEEKIVQLKDNMTEYVEELVAVEEPITEIKLAKTPTSEPVKMLVNGIAYGEGNSVTVDRAGKKVTWTGEFPLNANTVDKLQVLYVTGDKGPVAIPLDATSVYGMVLAKEGNRTGKWVRINENYETVDFDPSYGTWAGMKQVQNATYGDFTEIPITWVRTETLQSGPYAGCNCWWISDHEEALFHVHPAFIGQDGQPHNLQIASWIASNKNNVPFSADKGNSDEGYWNYISYYTVHAKGWMTGGARPYSIYDHHFLARMMLTEFGTPDVKAQTMDDVAWAGANRISYHGIHDPFGLPNGGGYYWLDGLTTLNGTYQVLASDGSRSMIETGVSCPNAGVYPINCLVDQVNGIDFGDLFIANMANKTENLGSFAGRLALYSNYMFCVGWGFSTYRDYPESEHSNLGWRVALCS